MKLIRQRNTCLRCDKTAPSEDLCQVRNTRMKKLVVCWSTNEEPILAKLILCFFPLSALPVEVVSLSQRKFISKYVSPAGKSQG